MVGLHSRQCTYTITHDSQMPFMIIQPAIKWLSKKKKNSMSTDIAFNNHQKNTPNKKDVVSRHIQQFVFQCQNVEVYN